MEDTSRRLEPAALAPCSCGDVLMLALVDTTAGHRGVVDEDPGEGLTHAVELAPWVSTGPQQGSREVGEGLPAEHLDDAVARRVADVERLEGTLMGRRRKGRRGWGGEAGGRWKRQRITAVPLCSPAT